MEPHAAETGFKKTPFPGNIPHTCRIRSLWRAVMLGIVLLPILLAGCAGSPSWPSRPRESPTSGGLPHDSFVQTGIASWYGPGFHGQQTACGETYDMYALTAAHKRLPFQSRVRVTNLDNGEDVVVRINDRGPFRKQRIIDLSFTAAQRLNMIETGTARVRIEKLASSGSPSKGYSLQLGSFKQRENARRLKRKARDLGLSHIRINRTKLQGGRYYRVLAGQFSSRSKARSALDQTGSHFPDGFILAD